MTINDIFQNLIRNFDQREQDLIKRRYGINPEGKEESLEKIGESYSVSRERIRQLQNKLANKINSLVNYSLEIDNIVEHVRKNYFGQLGFRKEETLKDLLKRGENLDDYHFYIFRFFSIFHKKIFYSFKDKNFHNFFCDSQETSFKVKELLENTYHHFVKINSTLKEEEVIEVILNNIKEHFSLETHSKEEIFDLLTTIKHLAKNPFGLWGLKTHSHISPKSLSEKIYLILKTKNQPLHFKEIHQILSEINKSKESSLIENWKREYNINSIKNELIRHPNFVLVGRGTYALKEWNMQEGKAKDLIKEIIKEKGKITRSELWEIISTYRQIKKQTFIIYLNELKHKGVKEENGYLIYND